MKALALVALAALEACDSAPVDALCTDVSTDAEVTSCAIATLNKAAGRELVRYDGAVTLTVISSGTTATLAYIDHAPGAGLCGLTGPDGHGGVLIQVERDAYGDRWTDAATLAHEIGHLLGLLFSDNAADPIHSLDPDAIMYHIAQPWLTNDNVKAFVHSVP